MKNLESMMINKLVKIEIFEDIERAIGCNFEGNRLGPVDRREMTSSEDLVQQHKAKKRRAVLPTLSFHHPHPSILIR